MRRILKQVPDTVGDTRSSSRSHCRPSGRSNSRKSGQVGAPDSAPSATHHHQSFTSSSTSQSFGGGTDVHLERLEEPTYADSCCATKEPFRTKNSPAALQPRGELNVSQAGPVGVDSPQGYGRC